MAKIGNYAFYYCTALREIHSLNEQPPVLGHWVCFGDVPETVFVYAPYESLEEYKNADVWSDFQNYSETASVAEHRFIDDEIRYVVNDDCTSVSVSYMSNDYDNYEMLPSTLRIPEWITYKDPAQLLPEDDAAIACWGDGWRMPTLQEARDLINEAYTTCELTTQRGVEGVKITSKSNGNSIFLPTAGEIAGSDVYKINFALYWTSARYADDSTKAMLLRYPEDYHEVELRHYGLPIRPVKTK